METVILIHGLWMRRPVMLPHQHWLRASGYSVRRFSYSSWRDDLACNVRLLSRFVNNTPGTAIHLVAHSLGGLVALTLLSQQPDTRIRRVVLMGTPYAGSHCGFTLGATPMLGALIGHTFGDCYRLPRPVLPPELEIGVIAGTRSIGLGRVFRGLARPNDGVVAVDETRIATARDSITLNVSHTGMLVSRGCNRQIVSFLRSGSFIHE